MSVQLSVSVIQFTGRDHLVRCLEALAAQQVRELEILVPHDSTTDMTSLADRFRGVRFLALRGRRTPAELRAAATAAATGNIIAFLEDHCAPASDWSTQLIKAHAAPHAAVGGAVEKGFLPGRSDDTGLNWAVYMTDYSRYLNPQAGGSTHSLTDCNVSYKRSALEGIRATWETEFHENIVNGLLSERGETLWLAPEVIVYEQRTLTLASALRDRFTFGRLFASTRVAQAPITRRLVYATFALVMPPVLVLRVARNLFGRGRHRAQFFRALVPLSLVTSSWMLGECLGYLTGRATAGLQPQAAQVTEGASTPALR